MTYVVDASVAAKWFLREPLHDQALALLDHVELLAAPDLIVTEVANIAWKKAVRGDIGRAQAQAMAAAIRHYLPTLQPSTELAEHAFDIALALNHPVYDCLYVACAEAAGGVLVTADQALCEAMRETAFAPLVRNLEDFKPETAPARES